MSQATYTSIISSSKGLLNLDRLLVHKRLWNGQHSDEYEVSYRGYHYALKVFRSTAIAAFNRELDVYHRNMTDPDIKGDCPVVKAYGWIKSPVKHFKEPKHNKNHKTLGDTPTSGDEGAQALIKELVLGGPFDLKDVPPGKMIDHGLALSRLGVKVHTSGQVFEVAESWISLTLKSLIRRATTKSNNNFWN